MDRLEQTPLSFHERVRQAFLKEAQENPHWLTFNADQSKDSLAQEISQGVLSWLVAWQTG
ncbi:MAG: hypothetical protein R2880_05575 [Deinococcales bacterium]